MLFAVLLVGAGAMRLIGPAILGTVDKAGRQVSGSSGGGGGGGGGSTTSAAGGSGGSGGSGTTAGAAGSGGSGGASGNNTATASGGGGGGAAASAAPAGSAAKTAESGDVSTTGLAKYADSHGGLGKWIAAFMIFLGLVAAFFAMKKSKAQAS